MNYSKSLLTCLLEDTNTDIYNALNDLYSADNKDHASEPILTRDQVVLNEIENALEYMSFNEDDIKEYKEQNNDFWNDKNKAGQCWCDVSSEWADQNTTIYNYTAWQHAPILSEWIEDSINELGAPEKMDLVQLFRQGECYFYEQFVYELLDNLKQYIQNKK